ncbi:hypothetical protein [Rhodococcus koreensis]|uniref:hypothetical protein n=1 Tax=Rhodococcus koreensis TaxID=99653 RepID=UPI0036DC244D
MTAARTPEGTVRKGLAVNRLVRSLIRRWPKTWVRVGKFSDGFGVEVDLDDGVPKLLYEAGTRHAEADEDVFIRRAAVGDPGLSELDESSSFSPTLVLRLDLLPGMPVPA